MGPAWSYSNSSIDTFNSITSNSTGNLIYAVVNSNTNNLYISQNNGVDWTTYTLPYFPVQITCNGNTVLIISNLGSVYMYVSISGTLTFLNQFNPTGYAITSVGLAERSGGGLIIIAISSNDVYYSLDNVSYTNIYSAGSGILTSLTVGSIITSSSGNFYVINLTTQKVLAFLEGYGTSPTQINLNVRRLFCAYTSPQYVYGTYGNTFYYSNDGLTTINSSILPFIASNGISSYDGSKVVLISPLTGIFNNSYYGVGPFDIMLSNVEYETYPFGNIAGNSTLTVMTSTATVSSDQKIIYYNGPFPACLLEGTYIKMKEDLHIKIENLKVGDEILTIEGPQKIRNIGFELIPEKDLKCIKNFENQIEPLYISNFHSILISEEKDIKIYGNEKYYPECYQLLYKISGYNKIHALHMKHAESYTDSDKIVKIYHIVLDFEDKNRNSGIYANGILVETCSISDYMKSNLSDRNYSR